MTQKDKIPITHGVTHEIVSFTIGLLLYVLPFSPLLVTLFSHFSGQHLIISSWKEILLFSLMSLLIARRPKESLELIKTNPLAKVILVYVLYLMIILMLHGYDQSRIAGFVFVTRFLVALTVGVLAARYVTVDYKAKKVVHAGIIVCLLGLVILALPNQLLTHIGYDAPGIDTVNNPSSIYYVSEGLHIERMMSSFKSPNSLGIYLLIPLSLLLFGRRKPYSIWLATAVTCSILLTFSRSAFIGLVMTLGFFMVLHRQKLLLRIRSISVPVFVLLATVVVGLSLFMLPVVDRLVLHQDSSQKNGSTSVRIAQLRSDTKYAFSHPFGGGLGSASLAGRLSTGGVTVSENYYLQLARESGVVGMIIFVCIIIFTIRELLLITKSSRHAILVSFIALLVAGLFIPVWADETISITWWLVAGIYIGQGLIRREKISSKNGII